MTKIDKLLAAMTVEEKIGQLNMVATGYAVTGPVLASGVIEGIQAGRIGSLLNIWGAREVHAVQKIAVEKTRLGIPLLIGFDVLHGHKTIFPIPLAEAASFDPPFWERGAREAAIEAAADGIAVTFAAPAPSPPRPSIYALMAPPSPGATTLRRMSPNVSCMKSICLPSRRRWPRAAPRSCRLSTMWPASR